MPQATQRLSPEYRFTPAPLVPRYTTSLINRASDVYWERRIGIQTTGNGTPNPEGETHHYGYLAYHTYFSILDALSLQPDDVVTDIGCGKGRVICAAATYPVLEVVGVDIDPALATQARMNAQRMRGKKSPIRVECISATDFDYDPVSVIVMFHPFGPSTMGVVLSRIGESLARRPRNLRIAYGNPMHSNLLASMPWLELTDAWNPGTWSRIKFPVHFYRSRPTTSP